MIMKRILLVALIVGAGLNAQAQSHVLKLNILSPIVKTANISYEKVLNEGNSFQIGVAYTGASIGETDLSGIQITPEYRFYLSDEAAPEGFYAAPFIRYSNLSLTEDFSNSRADMTSFGGGAVIGKQWIFKELITLETFLGPSYSVTSIDVTSGTDDAFELGSFDGFGIRFGVNFGITF